MKVESFNFSYRLNDAQAVKLEQWMEAHKLIFGEYGKYTYTIDPNDIDTFITIKSKLSNQSIDFLV